MRRNSLIWLILAFLLLIISAPSIVQAEDFGVSPAIVSISNLAPGEEKEFELTIYNWDDTARTFTLTTYKPEKSRLKPGRSEFPHARFITFSPQEIEVAANSEAEVKVKIAIPAEEKYTNKNWEIWLQVAPKDKDFLVVNYYIRLLVSTSSEVKGGTNTGLIATVICIAILLGCGIYYFRRKSKDK